jgi:hypothetical protein
MNPTATAQIPPNTIHSAQWWSVCEDKALVALVSIKEGE